MIIIEFDQNPYLKQKNRVKGIDTDVVFKECYLRNRCLRNWRIDYIIRIDALFILIIDQSHGILLIKIVKACIRINKLVKTWRRN